MNRRDILCSLSIPVATSVGGCLDIGPVFGGGVTLGAVLLENHDPHHEHRFDVRIKRDGETVHSGSYVVRSRPEEYIRTRFVDCSWEDGQGNFSIAARIDGSKWEKYDIQQGIEDDVSCAVGSVQRRVDIETPEFDAFDSCDDVTGDGPRGAPCDHSQ